MLNQHQQALCGPSTVVPRCSRAKQFVPRSTLHHRACQLRDIACSAAPTEPGLNEPSISGRRDAVQEDPGVGLKAVWYGAEIFGKLTSLGRSQPAAPKPSSGKAKLSREEALASVRADYAQDYFISGKGMMEAYDPQCTFADPFVSFKGVDHFKQNVGNLGALMSDVKLDVYSFVETESGVDTKWRFSCVLDLPWKPRIAAAGGTSHILSPETGLVVRHDERWDVEPSKVIKQLFRPAAKVPTNAAEALMSAVSSGDAGGVWMSLTPILLKTAGPIAGVTLLVHALAGADVVPYSLEVSAVALTVAAGGTELFKLAKGM